MSISELLLLSFSLPCLKINKSNFYEGGLLRVGFLVFAQVTKIDGDHSGWMFQLMRTFVAAVAGMRLMLSSLKVEDLAFVSLLLGFSTHSQKC